MVAAAVGVGTAVAGVAGSAMSADASKSAAGAQTQAAEDANEIQRQQYEQNTQNFQPYLQGGSAGLNALLYRLGLGGSANGSAPVQQKTYEQIRQDLLPQYTKTQAVSGSDQPTWEYQYVGGGGDAGGAWQWVPVGGDTSGGGGSPAKTEEVVDNAGLEAAIQAQLKSQSDAQASQRESQAGQQNSNSFGSLLKSYKPYQDYAEYDPYQAYTPYQEYTPFTADKFQVDPGYQFRLDQGTNQIKNAAAATGGLNSGRALKDLTTFNSGLASQEYQNAYNRYNNDYTTGFNAHQNNYTTGLNAHVNNYLTGLNSHIQNYNTGFNAFSQDQNNIFNKLASLAGMGQSSASSLAGVGQNYANQVSNNLLQSGNAQAAGQVGGSNAINQGIGTATNALSSYFMRPQAQSGYGTTTGAFSPASGSLYTSNGTPWG